MGTKTNPGAFDCYANAKPDEPMFILLGRDTLGAWLVRIWVYMRIAMGKNTRSDPEIVEALQCADQMEQWCRALDKKPVGMDAGIRTLLP